MYLLKSFSGSDQQNLGKLRAGNNFDFKKKKRLDFWRGFYFPFVNRERGTPPHIIPFASGR